MIDQLIIGDKASFDDFEASVKERTIKDGKKKEAKDTVPFSNLTYDFSAINGEVYWEEKELEYIFEITADTPEELEEKKIAFKSWIMNVMAEDLHDPFIHGYHFVATFNDIDVDDSEFEKSTITVLFTAYPYMISNFEKMRVYSLQADVESSITIQNNSSHRVTPTLSSDVPFTVVLGGLSYSLPAGEIKDGAIKLAVGANALTLKAAEDCAVKISFYEEVF